MARLSYEPLTYLHDLASSGVFPFANGRRIELSPREKVTPDTVAMVQANKSALSAELAYLQSHPGYAMAAFETHPEWFAGLIALELRRRGVVPAHYTSTVHCRTCGKDVPHFPVRVDMVACCVWCLNGLSAVA